MEMRPFALLWLFGLCLRLTVLAIPPIIPQLHESFHLTQTQIGALGSMPVLLLSFAALPGAFFIARYGAAHVIVAGILIAAIASALRAASMSTAMLFATTFVMGIGIAIMQPALPSIAREWAPRKIGLATAMYSNGLLVGEAISASLTIPLLLPLLGGDWRLSLVVWSLPLLAIAAWGFAYARAHHRSAPPTKARTWWPDWRSPLTWRLGFIAGGCSSFYFGTNSFLPDYLRALGEDALIASSLSFLNWMQIPASMLLLAFPDQLMRKRWPLAAAGAFAGIAILGIMTMSGMWIVLWCGVIGFCTAFVLILTLALPPMLVEAAHVHSVSAAVFAIGYLTAVVTPVLGGLAWDLTGFAWTAFLPAGLFGPVILVLALGMRLESAKH